MDSTSANELTGLPKLPRALPTIPGGNRPLTQAPAPPRVARSTPGKWGGWQKTIFIMGTRVKVLKLALFSVAMIVLISVAIAVAVIVSKSNQSAKLLSPIAPHALPSTQCPKFNALGSGAVNVTGVLEVVPALEPFEEAFHSEGNSSYIVSSDSTTSTSWSLVLLVQGEAIALVLSDSQKNLVDWNSYANQTISAYGVPSYCSILVASVSDLNLGNAPNTNNKIREAVLPGSRKMLMVYLRFADGLDTPVPYDPISATNRVFTNDSSVFSVNNFYKNISYGKIPNFVTASGFVSPLGTMVDTFSDWLQLSLNSGDNCNVYDWMSQANSLISSKSASNGIVVSNYNHVTYILATAPNCTWAGLAAVTGSWVLVQSAYLISYSSTAFIHELGHNLGFQHAHSISCAGSKPIDVSANCQSIEYGDTFDIMGYYPITPHFNTFYREYRGWLPLNSTTDPSSYVSKVTGNGTFTLWNSDFLTNPTPNAANHQVPIVLRVDLQQSYKILPSGSLLYSYSIELHSIKTSSTSKTLVPTVFFRLTGVPQKASDTYLINKQLSSVGSYFYDQVNRINFTLVSIGQQQCSLLISLLY